MSSRNGGVSRRRENVPHGGNNPGRAALQRSLDAYEGAMRNSSEPQAHVFDYTTGEHLFAPIVTPDGLDVTNTRDGARLAGAVLSRNHPDGRGITLDEVRFAAEHHLAELRVVTPDVRYVLYTLPRGGDGGQSWNAGMFQRQIAPAYEQAWPREADAVREDVWRGALAPEHADAALADAVWRRVAGIVGTSTRVVYKSSGWTEAADRASRLASQGQSAEQILARTAPARGGGHAHEANPSSEVARARRAGAFAREMQRLMEQQRNE